LSAFSKPIASARHRPRGPGRREGAAGPLLIAGQHDLQPQAVEHARCPQGAQRLEDDDVPALHVDHPRPAGSRVVQPLEALERTVLLEHGVEVPDQQDAGSQRATHRHEVPRALELRAVHPPRGESQRIELGPEQVARRPHPA
jgi:hypothetical protein